MTVESRLHRPATLPEPWVRQADIAEHASVSPRTVQRWAAAGMPHRKVSRRLVLYRLSECDEWLREQAGKAA